MWRMWNALSQLSPDAHRYTSVSNIKLCCIWGVWIQITIVAWVDLKCYFQMWRRFKTRHQMFVKYIFYIWYCCFIIPFVHIVFPRFLTQMKKCFSYRCLEYNIFIMRHVTFIYQCISYFKYKICSQIVVVVLFFFGWCLWKSICATKETKSWLSDYNYVYGIKSLNYDINDKQNLHFYFKKI